MEPLAKTSATTPSAAPAGPPATASRTLALVSPENRSMRAITYRRYGSPEVLRLEKRGKPLELADGDVLIRIQAAGINPYDWHFMRGEPYFMRLVTGLRRPRAERLGVDLAGRVEAVGRGVDRFCPGDEVFGLSEGTLAEYATAPAHQLSLKPAHTSFEAAAAVPLTALTALQGLRDVAGVRPGQEVLIIGASGGVGTFAVQIGKAFRARVTGVCSTRNLELVRSLGADHVIDYTRQDFGENGRKYDVIFQLAGTRGPLECVRSLQPHGTLIQASGESPNRWIGPMGRFLRAAALSPFVSQTLRSQTTRRHHRDLEFLAGLIEAGRMRPVIDRAYPLEEAAKAVRYLERGHARGKVVVTIRESRPERP